MNKNTDLSIHLYRLFLEGIENKFFEDFSNDHFHVNLFRDAKNNCCLNSFLHLIEFCISNNEIFLNYKYIKYKKLEGKCKIHRLFVYRQKSF